MHNLKLKTPILGKIKGKIETLSTDITSAGKFQLSVKFNLAPQIQPGDFVCHINSYTVIISNVCQKTASSCPPIF